MTKVPVLLSDLLKTLVRAFEEILQKNLVGICIYGSLTQAAFNPKISDIDCMVVTNKVLSDVQFSEINNFLLKSAKNNPWTKRLQMQFLLKNKILTMNAKSCLYQFGKFERCTSDGNPIPWINILKSGIILYGQKPKTFVPKITKIILLEALERELGYIKEEIFNKNSKWRNRPKYRAYAVLTLCRIMFTYSNGTIVSKKIAADWACKNLPRQWRELIAQAENYNQNKINKISLYSLKKFVFFTEEYLHVV